MPWHIDLSSPIVTHLLSAAGGAGGAIVAGLSKPIVSWFTERQKRNQLEDALYKEFCRNTSHAFSYHMSLSPNPNYARDYPRIEQWLNKAVYDSAVKESPVMLTRIPSSHLIGDTYIMFDLVSKKDRSTHRKELSKLLEGIQRQSLPFNRKLLRKYRTMKPVLPFISKLTEWEYRFKRLAKVCHFLKDAMKRNNPKHEGVSYDYDPYYGLVKCLRTGMYGVPVVYDSDGLRVPLGKDWVPLKGLPPRDFTVRDV